MTRSEDRQQQRAIESTAANLLITAPPGCGKTDVLARRATTLIPHLQPGQRILALTFSNKARENLRARLREVLGASALQKHVTVRNYHGHALEVVRAHARTLGVPAHTMEPPSQKLLKEVEARAGQFPSRPTQADVKAALAELEDTKRQAVDDAALLLLLDKGGKDLAYRIEEDRQARGELHYGDLLRLAQMALAIEPVAKLYQNHYGAVLVDEFQDLTPQQLDIVLRTCSGSRTFAGDQLQGIYSWAGAKPIEVSDTLAAICDEHVVLTHSYRSSPAVLTAVNAVSGHLGATHQLLAHDPDSWPSGGYALAVTFHDERVEAQEIAQLARGVVSARPDWSLGIITRSDWRAREVNEALATMGLPIAHWDAPLESPEVAKVLQKALPLFPSSASIDQVSELVLENLETEDPHHRSDVEEALNTLRGTGATTFAAAMRTVRMPDDTRPVQPGIHVLNAHRGKGQQFNWVVVLGLEEKHLPDKRSTAGETLREEEQVLLVMLSRAKHGVLLTRRKQSTASWGVARHSESRWWSLFSSIEQRSVQGALTHLASLPSTIHHV